MNDLQQVVVGLGLLLVLGVVRAIQGAKGRGWRGSLYSLKRWCPSILFLVYMTLVTYVVGAGVVMVPYIKEYTDGLSPATPLGELLMDGASFVWLGFVLWVCWRLSKRMFKPFAYTEQEKLWLREDWQKSRESRLFKWVDFRWPKVAARLWKWQGS